MGTEEKGEEESCRDRRGEGGVLMGQKRRERRSPDGAEEEGEKES